jgi:hypothetical protein
MQRPITLSSRTSNAAKRVVVPWRGFGAQERLELGERISIGLKSRE